MSKLDKCKASSKPKGEMMVTRREFLDALAVGAAGLAVGTTAKSYARSLVRMTGSTLP
jgi:hypothetical protein